MKRFIPVFLALVVVMVLISLCFAETVTINKKATEIVRDAKGWYYLNDNGSKMRFSDSDLVNVRTGQPFMATLSAEDMSVTDIAKLEAEKLVTAEAQKKQRKEQLIAEKKEAIARAEAIQQLKVEGKLDINEDTSE